MRERHVECYVRYRRESNEEATGMNSTITRVQDMSLLSGKDFERLVASLLKAKGFTIEYMSPGADGGIDILAQLPSGLSSGMFIIQCKRYSSKVGVQPVRDLLGVVSSKRANKGILITNSEFTQAAKDFADGNPVQLIDGKELSVLLVEEGQAVKPDGEACEDSYFTQDSVSRARKMERRFRELVSEIANQQTDLKRGFAADRTHWIDGVSGVGTFLQDNVERLDTLRSALNRLLEYIPSIDDSNELARALDLARKNVQHLLKLQRAVHNCEVKVSTADGSPGQWWFATIKPHFLNLYDILFRNYMTFLLQIADGVGELISSQGGTTLSPDAEGAHMVLAMDWTEFTSAAENLVRINAKCREKISASLGSPNYKAASRGLWKQLKAGIAHLGRS